ncbi:MAG: hypothetical protein U0165_19440 [Polyangiaceae bacterium]
MPPDLVTELKKPDAVPPVPFEDIRRQIEGALARSIEEVRVVPRDPTCGREYRTGSPRVASYAGWSDRCGGEGAAPGRRSTTARDLELLHTLSAW